MRLPTFSLLVGISAQAGMVAAILAKSYTTWDCCKPACADRNAGTYNPDIMRGVPAVCSKNNELMGQQAGLLARPGCFQRGPAYLCDTYYPRPTSEQMSYGFAIMRSATSCCKCYELTWINGAAAGKKMQVQVIGTGGDITTESANDILIYTPGGGVGPFFDGCRAQYGSSWGEATGGVGSADDCASLPDNLQEGCYWRWNWARGEINGWIIEYEPVQCSSLLTSISTCSPRG